MIIYKYIIFIMNILLLRANIFNHECKSKRICSRGYRRSDLWNEPLVRPTLVSVSYTHLTLPTT